MRNFYCLIATTALLISLYLPNPVNGQGCAGIDFSASTTSGCSPLVVKFTATGFPAGSTFTWDFGSGAVGGLDTIVKVFTNPGKYTVKLTISLPTGGLCNVSKTDYIQVFATPKPKFSVSPGRKICDGSKEVTFTDSTAGVVSREWVIDGVSYPNASQTIKHTFSSSGYKSVSLKVTNSAGCTGVFSDNKYVSVYDAAIVDFCASITVSKTSVSATFKPGVNAQGRAITTYYWEFPGGSPSTYTGQYPTAVTYSDPTKSYDVKLTVTTADGCSYSLSRTSFIQPFISIPKDSLCMSQQPFTITNLADNNGRGYFVYKMSDVMLELPQSGSSPKATYMSTGSYDFHYTFKYSKTSCENDVYYPGYVVIKGPKVNFNTSVRQLCSPKKIYLQNLTNTLGATKVRYTWYIFDSLYKQILKIGPTADKDTAFMPKTKGTYSIALVATSNNGCKDSLYQKDYITINKPKADFFTSQTTFCLGEGVTLKDATLPLDPAGNYTYSWTLTNIDTPSVKYYLTGKDANFKPRIPGRYTVMQVVENSASCRDTMIKYGYFTFNGVYATVKLSQTEGCVPLTLTALAKIEFQYPKADPFNPLKFHWSTDNDEEGVQVINRESQNAGFIFNEAGTYTIYFDIFDKNNCQSQVVMDQAINAGTGANFYFGPTKCVGDTVVVNNISKPGITSFKWLVEPENVGIIYPSDTVRDIKFVPLMDTCYTLRLVCKKELEDETCIDTIKRSFCMTLPKPDFYTYDTSLACASKVPVFARFVSTSENATSYFWDFGDGTTLLTDNDHIVHVYKKNNDTGFTVRLTAMDSNGCFNTIVKKHLVYITGPQPKFTLDKKVACDTVTVHFKDLSRKVKTATVFFDDGSYPAPFKDTSHFYKIDAGQDSFYYVPKVLAEDVNGCVALYMDTIRLYREPDANFVADTVGGCVPMAASFTDKSYNAIKWEWDLNGDGIIDDTTQNPSFLYDTVGIYKVSLSVTNKAGCTSTIVKDSYITVQPIPEASFTVSQDHICQKAIVQFTNTSHFFRNFAIDYDDGTPVDSNGGLVHQYYFDSARAPQMDSEVFIPKLRVYNDFGCMGQALDTIVVYPRPVVGFFADGNVGCNPFTVRFVDTSLYGKRQEWDFDNDGKADTTGDTVKWTFGPGYHTIRLKEFSKGDCSDSLIKVNHIYVQEPPDADFNVSDSITCVGDTVRFTDISYPAVRMRKWHWTFDEANAEVDTSNLRNPGYAFITPGYHYITLSVVDDKGCKDTVMKKAVFVEDQLPPQNTPILYVTVGDSDKVKVVWDESSISDFNGYRIYRGTDKTPIFSSSNQKELSFIDTDPTLDTKTSSYCYTMETVDRCGNISLPGDTSCTVVLTAAPYATAANLLQWTAYKGWPSVKRYQIFRSHDNKPFEYLGWVPSNTFQYIDSMLCDEDYTYYVEAEHWSARYFSRSNKAVSHPAYIYQSFPPELFYTTVDDGSTVRVHWDNGIQSNLKQYHIDRYTDRNGWITDYALENSTYFTDYLTDVNKESYTYRIRTEDGCGYMSPFSNIGKSILLKAEVKEDKVTLRWNRYANWPAGVNQYLVQVRQRNKDFKTIASLSASDTTYTDDSVYEDVDTAYCYRIVATEDDVNPDTSISNISCTVLASRIYVPNAFSPNNDGTNDIWKVLALGIYNNTGQQSYNFRVEVFNRWGQRVFQADDVKKGWDGSFQGKPAPMGVYVYRISAEGIDGKIIFLKGNITLLR